MITYRIISKPGDRNESDAQDFHIDGNVRLAHISEFGDIPEYNS